MKEMPSVTSTWASCSPGSRRRNRRSISPPKAATRSALTIAAIQKLTAKPEVPAATVAPK
jgi:hypothetical protein